MEPVSRFSSSLCLLLTPPVVRGCSTPLAQLRPALSSLPDELSSHRGPSPHLAPGGARSRGPAAFHRADLALARFAIRMPKIRLGSRALAAALADRISSGAMTPCFDSGLLHALVGSSAWCDDSARLPRAVRVERGPRELGRLRLAAARAVLTALTAVPPAWVRRGVDPGRFRPMCATHDSFFKVGCPMSRLTPSRSHA